MLLSFVDTFIFETHVKWKLYFVCSCLHLSRFVNLWQNRLFCDLTFISNMMLQKISKHSMWYFLFSEFCCRARLIDKHLLLTFCHACLHILSVLVGVVRCQSLSVHIRLSVRKVLGIENLFEICQHSHQIVARRIPCRVRRFDVCQNKNQFRIVRNNDLNTVIPFNLLSTSAWPRTAKYTHLILLRWDPHTDCTRSLRR